jgi:hypothetical protein
MNLDRYMKRSRHALAGALALAATAALANPVASQPSIPQDSMRLAVSDSGQTGAEAVGSATPRSHPANVAGVRRAAAEGPEALRRYIWRTRMVYNYYFWDFVKQE